MEFITSASFILPETAREWHRSGGSTWWNLWRIKLWPYRELVVGDIVYFYESPTKRIVWKSRVTDVRRFPYNSKPEVQRKLGLSSSEAQDSPYFQPAPKRGYGLFFKFRPLKKVSLPKPDKIRFPQKGWLRVNDQIAQEWLRKLPSAEKTLLDQIVPKGSLIERLRQLNEEMVGISPARVRSIVSQTIRRDSPLVKALKELCGFRCQFPGCRVRVPKRKGGFYI